MVATRSHQVPAPAITLKPRNPLPAHAWQTADDNATSRRQICRSRTSTVSRLKFFPIVDEFGVIVFDGDAELYTTTDGRQLRVVCTSGRLANADPTNEHVMQAMPTTQTTPPNHAEPTTQASAAAAAALSPGRARRDDSEEALWSGRRTRFFVEKYKENFTNIGKKGGLRNKKQLFLYLTDALNEEFECSLSVLQVTNKWKSLERAHKRTRENNRKSGSGTLECRFEEEMADIMDKQHHVSPIMTYTQGRKMVREDKETEPEARVQAAAPASQESSAAEKKCRSVRRKIRLWCSCCRSSKRLKKAGLLDTEKMALLERFVTACQELSPVGRNSIDEQMIHFIGRVAAKQFVKNKPNPEGIKLFIRCSSDGVTHDFELYQGKGTGFQKQVLRQMQVMRLIKEQVHGRLDHAQPTQRCPETPLC
ncbi:uncharacterized protein LOC125757442 [Rhipicephalus sanguineus]|uniref:uncharacterized protein LOC125757442 n=1 Tax=Rhipicephalus sanguineus TaxID=34632 RepID=UPI0020C2A8F2|nr:uncharacterized protein LOC125757442 [Rhipicephalus sanguineus]